MNKKEETRRFETQTLGLPPLKMILVDMDEESHRKRGKKTDGSRKTQQGSENRQLILKLIKHLTGNDQ
jgi:hypothetical protein